MKHYQHGHVYYCGIKDKIFIIRISYPGHFFKEYDDRWVNLIYRNKSGLLKNTSEIDLGEL